MSTTTPEGTPLPRGVIYDPKRKRYRVRLYRRSRPVYLAYASSYDEAIAKYKEAQDMQRSVNHNEGDVRGVDGSVHALANNLV